MTIIQAPPQRTTDFLWLDLTRKCQLACAHCYNSSGPSGTHGIMTRADWLKLLDQAAACGVRRIQLIGGEPTLHPDAPALVEHALSLGLRVEVYSNLVHVSARWWALLQQPGVGLATSYYSDGPEQHAAVTGRPAHRLTRANIENALRLGIPLRVGIVAIAEGQRVEAARRELEQLGVTRIRLDRVRPFGRGAQGAAPDASGLCGRCGQGTAAVGPDGTVSPCVMSGWLGVGNVQRAPLAAILTGPAMAAANRTVRAARPRITGNGADCDPHCQPNCDPSSTCDPSCDPNAECSPGTPTSDCDPRR